MKRVSDSLADLSRRAKSAEDSADAARAETRELLADRVAKARSEAERQAEQLHATTIAAEQDATDRWAQVQADWKDHVRTMRAHVQDKQTARDAKRTDKRAAYAEDYAEAAVAMAIAAIEEAEYAVLDATLARADAEAKTVV
jgi:hypothetical protein